MKKNNYNLEIYGGEHDNIPGCTKLLTEGDIFYIGQLKVSVLYTPCHTSGHVMYYIHPSDSDEDNFPGALFTGDTIFVGGVGAFFEGNSMQMVEIMKRVVKLPHKTLIYCGHEYALNFLPNACAFDASITPRLKWAQECRNNNLPAAPSTIAEEVKSNMYMRTVLGTLSTIFEAKDEVKLMEEVYSKI